MTARKLGLIYAAIHAERLGFIREICEDWSKPELPFALDESMRHLESGMLYTFKQGGIQTHRIATELEAPTKDFYDQLDRTIFSRQGASIKANRHNLDTVDFILKNDLDSMYYHQAYAIKKINGFLDNEFETFDFEKAVEAYRVELKCSGFTRVGKEDKAWIAIESTNYFLNRTWDPYLTKLLPIIHNVIREDSYYASWQSILDELKTGLGLEEIKKLELEAAQLEFNIKDNIFSKYSRIAHKEALVAEIELIRNRILSGLGQ
jgi:hypothetical protein